MIWTVSPISNHMDKTRAAYKKFHYVYKIVCLVTNKYYIGIHSTNNLNDSYFGSGKRLRYSVRKYSRENHKLTIIEFLPDRQSLILREAQLVTDLTLKDTLCLNLVVGGVCTPLPKLGPSPLKGRKLSVNHKQNVSAALKGHRSWSKGKKFSDAARKNCSAAMMGNSLSKEAREKISKKLMGHSVSIESRLKMSVAHKKRFEKKRLELKGPPQ